MVMHFLLHFEGTELVLYKYEPTSKVQPQNAAHTQAWGFVVLRVHLPQNADPSSKVQPQNAAHTTAPLAFFIRKSASPYCTIFIHTIVSKLPLCDKNRTNRWKSIIFL